LRFDLKSVDRAGRPQSAATRHLTGQPTTFLENRRRYSTFSMSVGRGTRLAIDAHVDHIDTTQQIGLAISMGFPTEVSGEDCMKTLMEMDLESIDPGAWLLHLLTVIWGS